MSSRLRSLDSKISFFAFADIITAVSGVLIFVALLLATDLGRPTATSSASADSAPARQLQETLARQLEVDTENQRLAELLATAQTSPDPGKLQADITSLRAQLAREQQKQAGLTEQLAASEAVLAARDQVLGLTGLNAATGRLLQEVAALIHEDTVAHDQADHLEQRVARVEAQLLKLRQREGQIWLIPEKSLTTKEPLLVTVAGTDATIDRFDHPEQRQRIRGPNVETAFTAWLHHAKTNDQYVVFLVKPSGIETFKNLLQSARDLGFDVGFDALEENREVHFSTPPSLDETIPSPDFPVATTSQKKTPVAGGSPNGGNPAPGRPGTQGGSGTGTGVPGAPGASANGMSANGSSASGPAGNGPSGHGPSGNETSGNGASVNGTSANGTAANGASGNNGAGNGTSGNGASASGTSANGGSGQSPAGNGVATNGGLGTQGTAASGTAGKTSSPPSATGASASPQQKSWWQRLLEWLGFRV